MPIAIPKDYQATESLKDAYLSGYNHGNGFACHNIPKLGDTLRTDSLGKVTVDADNIREVHESLCYEAEINSRDFSPFEFIAHEFNKATDDETGESLSDELWEAYEAGTTDSIQADLATYTDEDYGIEPEEDEDESE